MTFEANEKSHVVPPNQVESSLYQSIMDNHIYPEQAWAIEHHHYHGQQPIKFERPQSHLSASPPAEIHMTNPFPEKK